MFSKETINRGRQLELDIARGLAVLFMILIHAQIYFANEEVIDSYFADFNDFVGGIPAAPMFMFLLGVGINYSRKNNPPLMIKRGIRLLLIGYLLNFLRGFLPNAITAYISRDMNYLYQGIYELMFIDILQFSGLAMIMFALFSKFNLKNRSIAIIGGFFALLNILILNVKVDSFFGASFTGLFWGSGEDSFFPFLTWAFYPIAGFIFGSYLIRCTYKKRFYTYSAIVSAVVFLGGILLFNVILKIPSGLNSDLVYYHHIITDNIIFTAFVILEISLLSFVANLLPKYLQNVVNRWSKNVTSIYCIHWVILTWSALFIPINSLYMGEFILFLIVIIPLSDFLAYLYSNIKNKLVTGN